METNGDQGLAYERAVLSAREDPTMRGVIESAFLHEDPWKALATFEASEHWARVLRLLTQAGIGRGSRVLDFGGGRGLLAACLNRAGFEATLCEINTSKVCGTGAAEALRDVAGGNFAITSTPVGTIASSGPRFDAVVCRAVLHHVTPLEPTLTELRGALRPGGAFVASDEPTIRQPSELDQLRAEHPFVRFGVDEDAYSVAHYAGALRGAGFVDVRASFPVSLRDYRRFIRPHAPPALASVLYLRYRIRAVLRPVAGDVRSFVARNPVSSPLPS